MNRCLSLVTEVETLTFYAAGTKGRDRQDQKFYEISEIRKRLIKITRNQDCIMDFIIFMLIFLQKKRQTVIKQLISVNCQK